MARSTGIFTRPFNRAPQCEQIAELYELGEHLRDTIDLDLLTIKTMVGLNEIYELEHSAVFTRLDDVYVLAQAAGDAWNYPPTVPFDDPFVEMVRISEVPLRPAEVEDMSPTWLFMTEREVRRVFPLLANDEMLGFIAMGRKQQTRRYTQQELEALSAFGKQAGRAFRLALQVRARQGEVLDTQRSSAERNALRLLQRSLLPETIPRVQNWEISAISVPAPDPTGGWYEFLTHADRTLGIVAGSVVGQGMQAVRVMALASTTLRVEAQHVTAPNEVLSRVNYLLASQLPEGLQINLLYGRLEPHRGEFQFATVGPTSLLLLKPKVPEPLGHEADGILIGTFPNITYKLNSLNVPPQSNLVIYSSGVIKTATPLGQEFGLSGLLEAIRGRNQLSPGRLTASVLTCLRTFLGWLPLTADVALVALRRLSI